MSPLRCSRVPRRESRVARLLRRRLRLALPWSSSRPLSPYPMVARLSIRRLPPALSVALPVVLWGMPHRRAHRIASTVAAALAAATLAAVLAASTGGASGAQEAEPLTIMTFNIRTSGYSEEDGDNAWPHRRALVADTIARIAPEVAGLQEALADQLDYLSAKLPDYRWLGVDRGLNGGRGLSEHVPIFYRHRELLPVESGTFWLSPTPAGPTGTGFRRRVSRIVTWAQFHHVATDPPVLRLQHPPDATAGERQVNSATMIAERVGALPEGTPVLAIGDFNARAEDSDTWRAATSTGLRDAWALAGSPDRSGPHVERLPSTGAGKRRADRLDPRGRANRGPLGRDPHRTRQRAVPLRPLPGRRTRRRALTRTTARSSPPARRGRFPAPGP